MALTVDFLREFIEAYRNHVALWKVGSKEYVDKALKKAGYDELINKCWEFNIAADREFVVRKINSLRGAFRKEHNKVLAAASRGQKYLPVLWYYKLLLFTSDKDVPEAVYETESPDCKPEVSDLIVLIGIKYNYISLDSWLRSRILRPAC